MTKASLTFTVNKGVTVVREGQRIRPEIGKTFEFSAEERDNILNADPAAISKPADGDTAGTPTAATGSATEPSAEASQAKARGGRKASTANTSDAETKTTEPPAGGAAGDDDL